MDASVLIFITIVSLFIASFLNLVAIRIPRGESVMYPPSHCDECRQRLAPIDFIPILGFVLLKGRCRYCQARIPLVNPLGEMITTILVIFTCYQVGISSELLVAVPLIMLLATVTISDILYQIIPNQVNLTALVYFTLVHLIYQPLAFTDYLLGLLFGGGLLYLIAVASRGGMGGGDIKLMAVIGMAIGWKMTLLSFILASLIGGVTGVLLIAAKKISRREPIPFGPFLALGTIFAYFGGETLIEAYFNYFL